MCLPKRKGLSETSLIVCRESLSHNDSSPPFHSAPGTSFSMQTDRRMVLKRGTVRLKRLWSAQNNNGRESERVESRSGT